jgi:hypothetical protein
VLTQKKNPVPNSTRIFVERMCQNHQILRNRFWFKSPYWDNGVLWGCQNIGGFKFCLSSLACSQISLSLLVDDDYQCGYSHKTEEKTNPDWNKTIITNSFRASFDCLGDKLVVCRVNRPITDCLLMIKHFGRSFSVLFHFEWFKMLKERLLKLYKSSLKCKAKTPANKE